MRVRNVCVSGTKGVGEGTGPDERRAWRQRACVRVGEDFEIGAAARRARMGDGRMIMTASENDS
jgi:hypothetical protein